MKYLSPKAVYSTAAVVAAAAAGLTASGTAQAATAAPALRTLAMVSVAQVRPAAAVAWPLTTEGAKGEHVVTIQELLNQRLGAGLTVDGTFGPATTAAVRKLQAKDHLVTDGQVGGKTWAKLIVAVQSGARGPAVAAVQHSLKYAFGFSKLTVDGVFGPATQAAVRTFQARDKISVDGIVGVMTWNALVVHEG